MALETTVLNGYRLVVMNEHLSVETPEQIELNFQRAGIGTRFYAALLDTALLSLIVFGGAYVIQVIVHDLESFIGNWLGAVSTVIVFALTWGYYMVFEITTNGQSPGKMALGIRVIREGGYPITFSDSAVRNLVRIVDFLPFCYGIGLFCMLLNKNWQRLGDLAAGTLLVKVTRSEIGATVSEATANVQVNDSQPRTYLYAEWIQPALVTDTEFGVIREYLARRPKLSTIRRTELARTIGSPLVQKMGGTGTIGYDKFLEEVYSLKMADTS